MDRSMLTALIGPVVAPIGLEVDRVDVLVAGKRQLVRVRLDGDGPKGTGPDLDGIAAATKLISTALDQADLGDRPYVLEVSSRGVEAPLKTMAHFRRNRGRLVQIQMDDGQTLAGRIGQADEKSVEVVAENGQTTVVALAQIVKAVVQVEFNRQSFDEDGDEGAL